MSEQAFEKYIVQPNDTLESVAEAFNISLSQLRRFHNQRCELHHLLSKEIGPHNKYLLVPLGLEKEEPASEKKNNYPVLLNNDGSLSLRPKESSNTYIYTLSLTENGKKSVLDYTMDVSLLKPINDNYLYELNRRKPIYVNKEVVDDKMSVLSALTSEALYPLQLEVNKNGEVVQLHNYEELEKRIPETIEKIYRKFSGEIVDNYITLFEENMSDPEYLLTNIKNDLFINSFFSGLYRIPANEEGISHWETIFPVAVDEDVTFDFVQRVIHVTDEFNYVNVNRYGKVVPYENIEEMDGIPQKSGSYNANYYLHPKTNQLEKLNLNYKFKQDFTIEVEIDIKNIEPMDIPKKEVKTEIIKGEMHENSEGKKEADKVN